MMLLQEIADGGAITAVPLTSQSTSSVQKTAEKTSSAIAFTCFRKLPAELRVKIWLLVGPRTIRVEQRNFKKILWTCNPKPVTLKVCQESRVETLKSGYTAMFGSGISRNIYFDPKKDILAFLGHVDSTMILMQNHMSKSDISAVKQVRVTLATFTAWMTLVTGFRSLSSILAYLLSFVGLEKLIVGVPATENSNIDLKQSEPDPAKLKEGVTYVKFKDDVIEEFRKKRDGVEAFKGTRDLAVIFEYEKIE